MHLQHGALELGQEIEHLTRLRGPLLLEHALIEDDLFFILDRLEDRTRLIEQRVPQTHRFSRGCWIRGALLVSANVRYRYIIDPVLDDLLDLHHPFTLFRIVQNEPGEVIDIFSDRFPPPVERSHVIGVGREQQTAMRGFQRGDIVFDETAHPDDFDRVRSQHLLLVIAQRDVEENAGEQDDHAYAGGRAREHLEMKMLLAKQPGSGSADRARLPWLNRALLRRFGLAHGRLQRMQVFYQSKLPADSLESADSVEQSQYRTRRRNNPSAGATWRGPFA